MVALKQMSRLILYSSILFVLGETRTYGDEATLAAAREVFAAAVSSSLNLKRDQFQVIPVATPSEVYAKLTTKSLFAWTAVDRDEKDLVNGFAGSEEGSVAFETYREGGLTELLKACHVLSRKQRIPLGELVERVAFCLNRVGTGEVVFDPKVFRTSGFSPPTAIKKPNLRTLKSGEQLTYFTMIHGNTGTWEVWKVTLTILPDYRVILVRDPL